MVSDLKNYSSIIAFVGILTFIIIPLYQSNTASQDYLDIVSKSFQVTKAEFYELNIEAWAQIKKEGLSQKDLRLLYQKIADELLLNEENMTTEQYEDFIGINHRELLEGTTYLELALQSFQSEGLESGTFLGIQINSDDLDKSRQYYDTLKNIFCDFNVKNNVGVTLVGTLPGQLTEKELYRTPALAFSAINAQVQEGIDTQELLSFSGYTPDCRDYLNVDGKKININIALRYHAIDNRTYIHIGAPLIFQEY